MAKSNTQKFLDIRQIKEGILILNDGNLRGVMMVSSVNFALKSEGEQEAIVYQFQNFLNSLDFSCQILIQSRRLNITGYIDKLKNIANKQTNKLLKIQTLEYTKFVESIISSGTIMNKTFYVIIPIYLTEIEAKPNKKRSLLASLGKIEIPKLTEEGFQRGKTQLWRRMEFVALGLRRCGLRTVPLNTEELIELFWGLYHPQEAEMGYYPEVPPEVIE